MDDIEDEHAPLLSDARKNVERLTKPTEFRKACFNGLPWIIALMVLQVMLIRAESALQFPYLRSLQRCAVSAVATAVPLEWSGSDYCADRGVVTRLAQAEANYVQGVGMVCHCLCLPFLGWFADHFGRKPVCVLTFVGLLVEALLNAWRQSIRVLFVAVAIQMATNGLTPALLAMVADGAPPEERISAYVLCMAVAIPAYAGVYLGITHFVLAEHLHSYNATWSTIAALACIGLLVALVMPETLQRRPRHHPDSPHDAEDTGAADRGAGVDAAASGAGRETKVRVCIPVRLLTRCCGGQRASADAAGAPSLCAQCVSLLSSMCAPCAIPPLRFIMLLEAPMVIAMAAFSTLDGFALIAYSVCPDPPDCSDCPDYPDCLDCPDYPDRLLGESAGSRPPFGMLRCSCLAPASLLLFGSCLAAPAWLMPRCSCLAHASLLLAHHRGRWVESCGPSGSRKQCTMCA